MNDLARANLADAQDHEVLEGANMYDVAECRYIAGVAPFGTLDLVLKKEGTEVVLRFEGVHELKIDPGFPHSFMGLEILDVSYLGWEHSRVRVENYEDAPGISFWAKSVSRVTG